VANSFAKHSFFFRNWKSGVVSRFLKQREQGSLRGAGEEDFSTKEFGKDIEIEFSLCPLPSKLPNELLIYQLTIGIKKTTINTFAN
jgi:hypothetical protein